MSWEVWGSGDEFFDDRDDAYLDAGWATPDEAAAMRDALERCRTVLANMALEREGLWADLIGRRWPIHHEPLRADARNLLSIIDDVIGKPA